jgi:methylmalonyl-CoA mutase, N-terminal domain
MDLGDPGRVPVHPRRAADHVPRALWTMRQYAGFGTARRPTRASSCCWRRGRRGSPPRSTCRRRWGRLRPPRARFGEVGRVGVAIDTLDDMHAAARRIPLDRVSTSMTINATAAILLAMYIVGGRRAGDPAREVALGHHPERHPQGVHRPRDVHLSAGAVLALITDIFRFCAAEVPRWNTDLHLGYHIREAGATAVQEIAFTFANAIEYVQRALAAGLAIDASRRGSVLLLRLAQRPVRGGRQVPRRAPAVGALMRERFGASDESCRLRFHTQTGGVTLRRSSRSTTWCG